jgi:molecular chaperone DnaJ
VAGKPDYYKVLGWHAKRRTGDSQGLQTTGAEIPPRRNPDDKSARRKFKEISEAYAVLSNPEARKNIRRLRPPRTRGERLRFFGLRFPATLRGSYSAAGSRFFGSFGEHFSEIFGGRGRGGGPSMDGDPFGAFTGAMRGRDLLFRMQIDFTLAIEGGVTQINIPQRGSVSVRIPAGVDTGQKIRLRGKGEAGPNGAAAGDMIIELEVKPHPHFKREGLDLRLQAPITLRGGAGGAHPGADAGRPGDDNAAAGHAKRAGVPVEGTRRAHKKRQGDLYVVVRLWCPRRSMIIAGADRDVRQGNPMQPRQDLL